VALPTALSKAAASSSPLAWGCGAGGAARAGLKTPYKRTASLCSRSRASGGGARQNKTHHPIKWLWFFCRGPLAADGDWRGRIASASEQGNLLQGNVSQLSGGCRTKAPPASGITECLPIALCSVSAYVVIRWTTSEQHDVRSVEQGGVPSTATRAALCRGEMRASKLRVRISFSVSGGSTESNAHWFWREVPHVS
jgi:hypothetical protein